jgi:hypothetical protein
MKSFLKGFAGALAGAALGFCAIALATPTSLPLPTTPGPFLGDFGNNLFTLTTAYLAGSGYGAADLGSVSQTSSQANCTTIASVNNSKLHQVTTSASTGYVCLPTANPGKMVIIYNATGQTIDLYSNATSYTAGTADKINETAGTTPYTGLTTHKTTICISAVGGHWGCGSIS